MDTRDTCATDQAAIEVRDPHDEAMDGELGQLIGLLDRMTSRRGAGAMGASIAAAALARSAQAAIPAPFDQRLVLLVRRVCGAFSTAEYNIAKNKGVATYVNDQINLTADPKPAAWFAKDTTGTVSRLLTGTPAQLYGYVLDELYWGRAMQTLTFGRSLLTDRRIQERMVEFWTDHFNIDIYSKSLSFLKPMEEATVIRPFALGRFTQLLTGTANNSAMMLYLDNALNQASSPQENYAREILELQTVGVNGGYDEQDVKDVANIFAGWTLEPDVRLATFGQFKYEASWHNPTPSYSILNKLSAAQRISVPAGQKVQGDTLLTALGTHAQTAKYVSSELGRFLLAYDPSPFAGGIETAFNQTPNKGDIPRMIRAALTTANLDALRNATPQPNLKLMRPRQWLEGAIRAIGGRLLDPGQNGVANPCEESLKELDRLGNSPHAWGPPNGYPDSEAAWAGGRTPALGDRGSAVGRQPHRHRRARRDALGPDGDLELAADRSAHQ